MLQCYEYGPTTIETYILQRLLGLVEPLRIPSMTITGTAAVIDPDSAAIEIYQAGNPKPIRIACENLLCMHGYGQATDPTGPISIGSPVLYYKVEPVGTYGYFDILAHLANLPPGNFLSINLVNLLSEEDIAILLEQTQPTWWERLKDRLGFYWWVLWEKEE